LFIGYYASFAILLLVPIDITAVIIDRRSTTTGSDSDYNDTVQTLSAAYDAFFTIILILGSFVLVFEEYYNTDGNVCC
jgi:ABC-type cobalt transport system substrate-binding protein